MSTFSRMVVTISWWRATRLEQSILEPYRVVIGGGQLANVVDGLFSRFTRIWF